MATKTCAGCGDDIFLGVSGFEEQASIEVRMRGIKVGDGHVDTAHPNLGHRSFKVKNHTDFHRKRFALRRGRSEERRGTNDEKDEEEGDMVIGAEILHLLRV